MTTATIATIAAAADNALTHVATADDTQRWGLSDYELRMRINVELTWATVCDEIYTAIISNDDAALRTMGLYALTHDGAGLGVDDVHARRAAAADHYVRCARIARRNAATFDALYLAPKS